MDVMKMLGLGGNPSPPLGSGMAQQAAQIMQSRPYQLHVQEAQANGQAPMSPEQFAQMMSQQQQPRPQGLLGP